MKLYWTTVDVSRAAGISESMVRKWDTTGRLKPVARLESGVRLYEPDEVNAFIAARAGVKEAVSA